MIQLLALLLLLLDDPLPIPTGKNAVDGPWPIPPTSQLEVDGTWPFPPPPPE